MGGSEVYHEEENKSGLVAGEEKIEDNDEGGNLETERVPR